MGGSVPLTANATVDYDPIGDASGFSFMILCILFGVLVRSILRLIPAGTFSPPFTVVMFGLGAAARAFSGSMGHTLSSDIESWKDTHPHTILFMLVPPLLFESSFNVDFHVFKKVTGQCLLLAGPGVIMATFLTALIMKPLFNLSSTVHMSWPATLLLTSMVSATDPVAVTSVLASLGAPPKLSMLIEGESLLNDGSAFMIFVVLEEIVATGDMSFGTIVLYFVRLAGGGVAWGMFMAFISYIWLKQVREVTIDITLLIVGVYATFYIGEHILHVSGVLSTVVYGVSLAKYKTFVMDQHTLDENHGVWEEISFIANTFIFTLAGVIVYDRISLSEGVAFDPFFMGMTLVLYIVCSVVRAAVMASAFPALKRMGYGLSMKEAFLVSFSGLRGAISLALALIIERNELIDNDVRDVILIQTAGLVAFTLVVNGSTVGNLYRRLDVYPENAFVPKIQKRALLKVHQEVLEAIENLRTHWYHKRGDVNLLATLLPDLRTARFSSSKRLLIDSVLVSECWKTHSQEVVMNEPSQDAGTINHNAEITDALKQMWETSHESAENDHGQQEHSRILRGFGFEFGQESGIDLLHLEGSLDASKAVAIYTILLRMLESGFNADHRKGKIARECLGRLEQAGSIARDTLEDAGISGELNDLPFTRFWEYVRKFIFHEEGRLQEVFSHNLFTHLIASTEMLHEVITLFRDMELLMERQDNTGLLSEKVKNVQLELRTVWELALDALDQLHAQHSKMMYTVHTIISAQHCLRMMNKTLSNYRGAGLLSESFESQSKLMLDARGRSIALFFQLSPFRKIVQNLVQRWNIIVAEHNPKLQHPKIEASNAQIEFENQEPSLGADRKSRSTLKGVADFVNPMKDSSTIYHNSVSPRAVDHSPRKHTSGSLLGPAPSPSGTANARTPSIESSRTPRAQAAPLSWTAKDGYDEFGDDTRAQFDNPLKINSFERE